MLEFIPAGTFDMRPQGREARLRGKALTLVGFVSFEFDRQGTASYCERVGRLLTCRFGSRLKLCLFDCDLDATHKQIADTIVIPGSPCWFLFHRGRKQYRLNQAIEPSDLVAWLEPRLVKLERRFGEREEMPRSLDSRER